MGRYVLLTSRSGEEGHRRSGDLGRWTIFFHSRDTNYGAQDFRAGTYVTESTAPQQCKNIEQPRSRSLLLTING